MSDSALLTDISKRGYKNPDVLVSTDWVAAHSKDANVRIIESNEDSLLYPSGHIPGAVQVDWAVRLAREHLGLTGAFKGLRNLKFVNPVLPDSAVTLTLESSEGALSFAYRAAERAYSSGKVLFSAAAHAVQP